MESPSLAVRKDGCMRDRAEGWGDAELAALGRIAANFAELDWQADRLLAGFITPHRRSPFAEDPDDD
jgi:hypothetical protein